MLFMERRMQSVGPNRSHCTISEFKLPSRRRHHGQIAALTSRGHCISGTVLLMVSPALLLTLPFLPPCYSPVQRTLVHRTLRTNADNDTRPSVHTTPIFPPPFWHCPGIYCCGPGVVGEDDHSMEQLGYLPLNTGIKGRNLRITPKVTGPFGDRGHQYFDRVASG